MNTKRNQVLSSMLAVPSTQGCHAHVVASQTEAVPATVEFFRGYKAPELLMDWGCVMEIVPTVEAPAEQPAV